jgi:hypothetical protein
MMKSLIRPPADGEGVRQWYAVGRPVVERVFQSIAGQDKTVDVVELCALLRTERRRVRTTRRAA